ncbi:hypothetical protein [Cohnella fermenti]|uniref:Uncharacterized protein n=1 Tax=Cohnella fermenti TaxID=2565925 RepID=A0A4S4BGT6_9BACL|nr:hypothetical protein [Cohnella fermenti]THF73060.1 hypothetical protein E6C55_30955 [Cohnella fermenti]
MIVRWLRPDLPPDEWDCPDVEQLLFLLRLVPTLYLDGKRYRFAHASLLIEQGSIRIAIQVSELPPEERLVPKLE